ncbi:hypothetical protein [Methanogenium cariaci]|uniref:hypothetical protein n=1 Tax=Methanogenium cariaci TaxID=2197 RepID=UPI001582655B|nr:hypothetical protein [Methanogenium cariaci]
MQGAIVLALYFRSAYQSDKEWLMAQVTNLKNPAVPENRKATIMLEKIRSEVDWWDDISGWCVS